MLWRRLLTGLLLAAAAGMSACGPDEPELKADGKPQPPVVLMIGSDDNLVGGGTVELELRVRPEVDAEDFYVTWEIPDDVQPVDAKGESRHLIKRNDTATFTATIAVPDSLPRDVTANVMFKAPDGSMFGDHAIIHLGRPRSVVRTPTPLLLNKVDGNTEAGLREQKGQTRLNGQPVN